MATEAPKPSQRSTALFVLSTGHIALRELKPVLMRFHSEGWRVVLRLGASGTQAQDAVAELRSQGVNAALIPRGIGYTANEPSIEPSEEETGVPAVASRKYDEPSPVRELLKRTLRPFLVHRFVALWRYYREAMRNRRWGDKLLAEQAPDVVLLNMFHSVGQVDNAVQRSARRAGIPLYCLTNSPYVGEGIHLVARMNHLKSGMAGPEITANYDLLNRLLARLFRRWTRMLADGTVAFYWDPVRILAAQLAGLNMNRLWVKPSLDFDKVFVFGEFSRKLLAECGYPQDRIVVAGQPLLDEILRRREDPDRQREIASHIAVAAGAPFLLLNVEPSLEHSYASPEDHWRRFHEVMRACSGHGLPVIVSLHPLCDAGNYRVAETQYNARISAEITIHELYPSCTVSVSFPCSTNLLALQFEKPLVVYDFHQMLDRDAVSDSLFRLPGMLVARSESQLRAQIGAALASARPAAALAEQPKKACTIILETVSASLE